MPFDEQTHQKMANTQGRDPRDLDGDGVVSQEEAEAYVRDFMQQASPEEQRDAMQDYLRSLSPEQRNALLHSLEDNPTAPLQKGQVQENDQGGLADALRQSVGPLLQGGAGGLGGLLGGLMGGQQGGNHSGQLGHDRVAQGQQAVTDPQQGNATADGRSPMQQAFDKDGALGNPMVQAGLVGLAGIIGSRMLRRR